MHQYQGTNYYSLLGISQYANQKEIKDAYRKLAVNLHPDTQEGLPEEQARALFIAVNEAYETLSHPVRRSVYDSFLHRQRQPAQTTTTSDNSVPPEEAPPATVQDKMMGFQQRMYRNFFRYHTISLGSFLLALLISAIFLANIFYFGTYQFVMLLLPMGMIVGMLAQYYYVFVMAFLNNMHERTQGAPIKVLPVWKCAVIAFLVLSFTIQSEVIVKGPFPDWIIAARNYTGDPYLQVPERTEALRKQGQVVTEEFYYRSTQPEQRSDLPESAPEPASTSPDDS